MSISYRMQIDWHSYHILYFDNEFIRKIYIETNCFAFTQIIYLIVRADDDKIIRHQNN